MALDIRLVPLLKDNYGHLLHDPDTGDTAVVDPAEAGPILAALKLYDWTLTRILNTHHHNDHIGGNKELVDATGATVSAAESDRYRIPGIDIGLKEGDAGAVGNSTFRVIEVPGHTSGHLALYFADDKAVFSGDTLFVMGCGRLAEGTAPQLWHSLSRLRALPDDTRVYCAHEYTQVNCRFALTVEPGNAQLQARSEEIARMRAAGLPTIPSTIGAERATNPFFRADLPTVQEGVAMPAGDPAEVFAEVRRRKDKF